MDGLDLGVVLEGVFAELSTNPRMLVTTERYLGMQFIRRVDPKSADLLVSVVGPKVGEGSP